MLEEFKVFSCKPNQIINKKKSKKKTEKQSKYYKERKKRKKDYDKKSIAGIRYKDTAAIQVLYKV